MKKFIILLFMIIFCTFAFGEEVDIVDVDDVDEKIEIVESEDVVEETEIENIIEEEKTENIVDDIDDYEADFADFAIADTIDQTALRDIVRREYNHRRQTRLAIWMMVFVVAAFTTAQSWNPR